MFATPLMNNLEMESRYLSAVETSIRIEALAEQNEPEVLAFLSERPIHTVALVGFIRDNGLVSPLNRGTFYGCRNRKGQLEGVALIGHATLMETTTDRALEAFAEVARKCAPTHLIMGEKERIDDFWNYYAEGGQELRLACREILFELKSAAFTIIAHHCSLFAIKNIAIFPF